MTRYPVGLSVTVYYNPLDPADSVLEPGTAHASKPFNITIVLCISVGSLLLAAFLGGLVGSVLRRITNR